MRIWKRHQDLRPTEITGRVIRALNSDVAIGSKLSPLLTMPDNRRAIGMLGSIRHRKMYLGPLFTRAPPFEFLIMPAYADGGNRVSMRTIVAPMKDRPKALALPDFWLIHVINNKTRISADVVKFGDVLTSSHFLQIISMRRVCDATFCRTLRTVLLNPTQEHPAR